MKTFVEFPKHVYNEQGFIVVNTPDEQDAAIKRGYSLKPVPLKPAEKPKETCARCTSLKAELEKLAKEYNDKQDKLLAEHATLRTAHDQLQSDYAALEHAYQALAAKAKGDAAPVTAEGPTVKTPAAAAEAPKTPKKTS